MSKLTRQNLRQYYKVNTSMSKLKVIEELCYTDNEIGLESNCPFKYFWGAS